MREEKYQIRAILDEVETREEEGELYLEGYFAVFNQEIELWKGAYEEIAPEAFANTLGNDIRALINHDTTYVLGRNKANTLELKPDSYGLWGKIRVNQKDTDALNTYYRVQRGDISGNSFGFNILGEETEIREDGTVKWRITEIDLHEVSVVTFPAYEQTSISARKKDFENIQREIEERKKKHLQERKNKAKERLENVKTVIDSEKNPNRKE